jgi:hypothetical protein
MSECSTTSYALSVEVAEAASCATLVVGEGKLPMPALGQLDDALEFPAFHIPDRPIGLDDHAAFGL